MILEGVQGHARKQLEVVVAEAAGAGKDWLPSVTTSPCVAVYSLQNECYCTSF